MKSVHIISGTAVPLDRSDVDTDQIIPSDWLKRVERTGFDKGLFSEWRDAQDFVLNDERFVGATILIAGRNFGVGSSREHAVWAIQQYGFDAVIAPRFGDIFRNNAGKNGLLPVVVEPELGAQLLTMVDAEPELQLTLDVEKKLLEVPAKGISVGFPLADAVQHRLLNGLDDIGITLDQVEKIDTHEESRPTWLPAL